MLRLTVLAAAMSAVLAGNGAGKAVTIYTFFTGSDLDASQALCEAAPTAGAGVATGAANTVSTAADETLGYMTGGGPVLGVNTGVLYLSPFIVGECYNTDSTQAAPIKSGFAGGHPASLVFTDNAHATDGEEILSFKLVEGTTALQMNVYIDQACATLATKSSGVLNPIVGDSSGAAATEVLALAGSQVWSYGFNCAEVGAAATMKNAMKLGYTATDAGGVGVGTDNTKNAAWPVRYVGAKSWTDATCATATANLNAANAGKGETFWPIAINEYMQKKATGGTWATEADAYKWSNAQCYSDNIAASSWQVICDPMDGSLTYAMFTGDDCNISEFVALGEAGANDSHRFTKNDKCELVDTSVNWSVDATDAEWESSVCPTNGVVGGTTAASYIPITATTTAFAAAINAAVGTANVAPTGAEIKGTKDIILDLCYSTNGSNEATGFIGGPFGDGDADITEHPATKGSYMFTLGGTNDVEVQLVGYAEDDCSGTAATALDDAYDGNGWPYKASVSALFHGALTGASATKVVATASKYITVMRHTDTTTSGVAHGGAGICLGQGTKSATLGSLDHFVLDNCHIATGHATAASNVSYKWACDTSDATITYNTYPSADCTGTAVTTTALTFTKTTGQCLQVGAATSNVSWEIRNDATQWAAMCAVPSTSTSTTTSSSSTSGASTIAATAAAAAAAAALLL